MSKLGWAARIGGYVAAPFTGGLSIPAGQIAGSAIEKKQHANDGPNGGPKIEDGTAVGTDSDSVTSMLQKSATNLTGVGTGLVQEGGAGIHAVLSRLLEVLSGNGGALMDATRPDRARVIDQYDTARKTISQFGPRGGGQTGALASANVSEGQDLAMIGSNARNHASDQLGQLGSQTAALGLNAQQLASADLNQLLSAILTREGFDVQKRGQNMEALAGLGEALGAIAAAKMGGKNGGGGGGTSPGIGG